MRSPVFLTLTIPHTAAEGVGASLARLHDSWGRLRRLKWFREKVRGGVAAVEISCGSDASRHGPHPHIHALLDCGWLSVTTPPPRPSMSQAAVRACCQSSQREVSDQWALCARVPTAIIYVRRPTPGTTREVLKYSVTTEAMLDPRVSMHDLIDALAGRKAVMPWGTVRKALRSIKAQADPEETKLRCECGASAWQMR